MSPQTYWTKVSYTEMLVYPGRPGVVTGFPLFAPFFTLQRIEVFKSVTLKDTCYA